GDAGKLAAAVQSLVQSIYKQHKAVIFNGNNYSEEWHQEAEKRGLPNLRNTVDALGAIKEKESIALFDKYGVLNPRETESRYDIYVERYCKDINTEGRLCLGMARSSILPAAYRYQGELAQTAAAMKACGRTPDTSSLDAVTELTGQLEGAIKQLQHAVEHTASGDLLAHAKHYRDEVCPAMLKVRGVADELEQIVADDLWPLPTYREILFIR
ncbi:MAG: glutamine synthetase type III, partial [Planctomycetaceae bacterium]|nr:glutamine synthetase type III [Planctomycetaceae bacterium]